jgi:hypothetical protein
MADDRPTYGTILGRNISGARGRLQLSQSAVAERMKKLGFDWHQQTAAAVEKGKRRVTTEEIFGLSVALETTMFALMAPPEDEHEVVGFPSGEIVWVQSVRQSVRGHSKVPVYWDGATPVFSALLPLKPDAEGSDPR